MHHRKQQEGFTLSEVLVAISIFTIVILGALLVYDRQNRTFKQGVEAADMQQATRIAFDRLVSEVRMTGFDYDRDGIPESGQEQPDEQIEYAGTSAMTIRANFNYYTAAAADHGRETAYESTQFPVVTTGNDEIVTYALKSANPAANTGSISFYADVARPRSAYSGAGGGAETQVTISGIDTTNNNPPYTLYRFTLQTDGTPDAGTPVAENIRSLNFNYYTDYSGATLLKTKAGAALTQGAIGGDGKYDPANVGTTTNYSDRDQRALIRSIGVQLIGMASSPDPAYTNTAETSTVASLQAVKKYREYSLQTLVVPRNLGLIGASEPALGPPGPPHVTSVCSGTCGGVYVTWNASSGGSPVSFYQVCYDTNVTGTYQNCSPNAANFSTAVNNLSSGTLYYFKVKAINSEGQTLSDNEISKTVIDTVKPVAPADLAASTGEAGKITLTWTRPITHDASANTLDCQGAGGATDGSSLPAWEPIWYRIYRSTTQNFTPPGQGTLVLDETVASQPTGTTTMTWVDSSATSKAGNGPTPCVQYYYKIQVVTDCAISSAHAVGPPAQTSPANVATGSSTFLPAGNGQPGGPAGNVNAPGTTGSLSVVIANSGCNSAANKCNVRLSWPAITQDTAGNSLTISTYNIYRSRQAGSAGAIVSYPIPTAMPQITNASGSPIVYDDNDGNSNPMPDHDGSGNQYYYYYQIAAVVCGTQVGAQSNQVKYPGCAMTGTGVAASGSVGGGTGVTPADPWQMETPNTAAVTVTAPAGHTLQQVVFTLMNGSTVVDAATVGTSPFRYTWRDQTAGIVYTLNILATDTSGCSQSINRYITEQTPSSCFPSSDSGTVGASSTSGSTKTTPVGYLTKNLSTLDDMTITNVYVTWAVPANYSDIKLTSFGFNGTTTYSVPSGSQTTTPLTVPAPTGTPVVPKTGTNYALSAEFQYSKNDNSKVDLITNPISKLCIAYTIPDEPGVTKFCNIVPSAGGSNPGSCQ